jgi:ribosome-binding protein aMBF1 (putative translation factor)
MKTIRGSTRPKKRLTTRKTTDAAVKIDKMICRDMQFRKLVEQATLNAHIAQLIFDARTAAKLTQQELAQRIRTTQSVIARLEDADYEGHSLSMLSRIAMALGQRIELRFVRDLEYHKRA